MTFPDHWFLLFAAAFFPLYWLAWHPLIRSTALLAACVIFHWHYAGPAGVAPIIVLAAVTYACGLSGKSWACALGIGLCVLSLLFYKYAAFLSTSLLGALHPAWGEAALPRLQAWQPAVAPLAVSFFVFEFVHYLVEIRRGGPPIRRPDQFALFALFFPSLVAGPIKRYQPFSTSLQDGLAQVRVEDVAAGAQRVVLGFAKKVLLADNLTAGTRIYEGRFASLAPAEAWLFLAALAFRILLDFSAYSDIAIGLARMLGISLPENFNFPYLATSLRDFWARWHISLSTWIRDYLYIPLGGNRHGPVRRVLYVFIAFGLCGLWHGPAWHFVLWGLWHGFGLAVNSTYRSLPGGLGARLAAAFTARPWLGWIPTTLFTGFGWLLFFYEPAQAWAMAVKLLTFR